MSREEMLNLLDVMERRIVYGQPYGDLIDKLRAALSKKCKYGDQSCPCQDGDMCHYEGPNPAALARQEERERAAKVCDEYATGKKAMTHYAALTYANSAQDCAAAIRRMK